jgi:hypothetical protein
LRSIILAMRVRSKWTLNFANLRNRSVGYGNPRALPSSAVAGRGGPIGANARMAGGVGRVSGRFGLSPISGLIAQAVIREPLAFVAPRDDIIAAERATMDLGDALDLPLILPGRPHALRQEVEFAASKFRAPDIG